MSIYSTHWEIKLPRRHPFDDEWVTVYGQGVPAHIGHPSAYPEGDPYAEFLPPVVMEYDPETDVAPYQRAMVIVQEGRDRKEGQRYVDPLIVMSGEEYARIPFRELLNRICQAMGWDDTVIGLALLPNGKKEILRSKQ